MRRISRVGGGSLAVLMLVAMAVPGRAAGNDPVAAALLEAHLQQMRGENEAALASFRHAVELSGGKSFPTWQGVTNLQMSLRQYGEAIESARQARAAAATPEEQSAAASLLGSALLGHGDAAEAVAVFKDLVAAAGPGAKPARAQLVGALLLANREGEATEVLRAYRAAGATDGDVRLLLCHAAPILAARQKETVNERLRALDPAAPLLAGGTVKRPEILERTPPPYTEEARQARVQGVVILQTVIGADGHVGALEVLKGLPMGLAESAVDAVKQWTFQPATLDGAPVPVCYVLTINFQLDDKPRGAAGEAPRN